MQLPHCYLTLIPPSHLALISLEINGSYNTLGSAVLFVLVTNSSTNSAISLCHFVGRLSHLCVMLCHLSYSPQIHCPEPIKIKVNRT